MSAEDYDDAELEEEVEAARQRLLAAVEADPLFAAMADLAETATSAYLKLTQAVGGPVVTR